MSTSTTTPPFLRLPPELRLRIYTYYFSSTPLHYPFFHHALSPLLLTSHQIHSEALPLLLPSTHHIFPNTEALITYLSSLPPCQLQQLRYIEVTGHPIQLYNAPPAPSPYSSASSSSVIRPRPLTPQSYNTFTFQATLSLFPGLRLDTLVVWDAYHDYPGPPYTTPGSRGEGRVMGNEPWANAATQNEVQALISRGLGWRTLVFRSWRERWSWLTLPSYSRRWLEKPGIKEAMMTRPLTGEENEGKEMGREERQVRKLEEWRDMLRERDGEGSGCEVEMWTVEITGMDGGGDWDTPPGEGRGRRTKVGGGGAKGLDEGSCTGGPVGVEIRVSRGKGRDCVQDGVVEDKWERNLKDIFEEFSWKEIQAQGLFVRGAEDDRRVLY